MYLCHILGDERKIVARNKQDKYDHVLMFKTGTEDKLISGGVTMKQMTERSFCSSSAPV